MFKDGDRRSLRPAAAQPARFGHRSLQPPLPLLHAGARLRLAAERDTALLRGDRRRRRRLHEPRRRSRADHRRRAAAAPRPADARPHRWPRATAIRDLALTTNGVLLAPQARGAARRRAAPDHRQPRHARARRASRPSPASTASTPSWPASTRPRRPASTRSRSTRSSCAASTTTSWSALIEYGRRIGAEVRFIEYMDVGGATRWSTDAVVSRREMLDALEAHYGGIVPHRRVVVGAGRSLPPARRHHLRHHLVDDRAVLRIPATAAG